MEKQGLRKGPKINSKFDQFLLHTWNHARRSPDLWDLLLNKWETHSRHRGGLVPGDNRSYSNSEILDALANASRVMPRVRDLGALLIRDNLDVNTYQGRSVDRILNLSDAVTAAILSMANCKKCNPIE